jgi:hypothetical protein
MSKLFTSQMPGSGSGSRTPTSESEMSGTRLCRSGSRLQVQAQILWLLSSLIC